VRLLALVLVINTIVCLQDFIKKMSEVEFVILLLRRTGFRGLV